MQQFGKSVFHMIVRWQKLGEMENECTLHNFIVLVISMSNIIKFSEHVTKLWQKQFWLFFETRCILTKTATNDFLAYFLMNCAFLRHPV